MKQIKCPICKENNEIITLEEGYKYHCNKCKYTILDKNEEALLEMVSKFKKLF